MPKQIVSGLASPKLRRFVYRRKLVAFFVTTGAGFALSLFCWSLTIKGYQTKAEISIRLGKQEGVKQEFQALLANAIRTKVSDKGLSDLLIRTDEQVPIQSQILLGDHEQLRKSMLVQAVNAERSDNLKVQLTLLGQGTKDEQVFLKAFSRELSDTLTNLSKTTSSANQFTVENAKVASFRDAICMLEDSVEQLDEKINSVCQLIEQSLTTSDSGPFRIASHSNQGRNSKISEVHQTIANIDLEYMRQALADLKYAIDEQANSASSTTSNLHSTAINGPQGKQVFILLILASAFGLFTANHFQPFADRGFSGIASVSNLLKIPVVAALPINPRRRAESLADSSKNRKQPWANRVTKYARVSLLAFLIFVAGFCCIDQEIRETFFRNPVDGTSRVLMYFKSR